MIGFVLFFPLDPVARKVELFAAKRANLTLKINQPGWGFPPAINARDLTLSAPALQGETIRLEQLSVAPYWSSLFSGNPGLKIVGQLFSGQLEATARQQGDLLLTLRHASLSGQQLSPQLSLLLSAVNGNLEFTGALPFAGANQSQVELSMEQLEISGMDALGSRKETLSAGNLQLKAESKGANVTLKSLELSGGDLALSGSGSLLLGSRPELSRLNLSLELRPGATLDPQLRDLLALLAKPEPDGTIKFRLLGSLAAPQLR